MGILNKNNLKTVCLLASLSGALVLIGRAVGGQRGAPPSDSSLAS